MHMTEVAISTLTVMGKCVLEEGEDLSASPMNEEEVNKCCRCSGLPT